MDGTYHTGPTGMKETAADDGVRDTAYRVIGDDPDALWILMPMRV